MNGYAWSEEQDEILIALLEKGEFIRKSHVDAVNKCGPERNLNSVTARAYRLRKTNPHLPKPRGKRGGLNPEKYSQKDVEEIKYLKKQGLTYTQIASIVGATRCAIGGMLFRLKNGGRNTDYPIWDIRRFDKFGDA